MAYWWASQGRNYNTAIAQGSLWTSPWPDGRLRQDRILIKSIERGDIVFHYARGQLRAVSRVVEEWVPAPRPTGYPKRTDADRDEGWLARVEPIAMGLDLDRGELPGLITVGTPGPLDRDGMPQEKYLSAISDEDGQQLLDRLGVDIESQTSTTQETSPGDVLLWELGETDAETIGKRRREQGQLRAYLLTGRDNASCDLCGRELPASLLVAAHIKPRAISNEEHRKELSSIAMLACALGCDQLFERGYLTVDGAGVVRSGRPAGTDALRAAVGELAGSKCTAHNAKTASDFADRAKLVAA